MRTMRNVLLPLALLGIFGAAAVSCAPPPADTNAPTEAADPPAAQQTAGEQAHEAPSQSASEQTAEGPSEVAAGGASCLHGTWLADNEFFLDTMKEYSQEVESVKGKVLLEFTSDGTFSTDYQDWTITAEAEGVSVQVVRAGTDTGVFSATDSNITFSDKEIGSKISVQMAAMSMDVEPERASYTDASYTCSATEATISTDDGDIELGRE